MRIAAGIVLYNPDISRLRKNINSIASQVERVFLFDNASQNINEISALIQVYNKIILLKSDKNKGVAAALNQIANMSLIDNFNYLITLDQDSICPPHMISEYSKFIGKKDVAIVCPRVIDSRQKYKYAFKKLPIVNVEEVHFCITSGSLVKLDILKQLGWFDDFLFIDYVDYDYCKRVIINQYKILRVNSVILDQEFGELAYSKYKNVYLKIGKCLHSRFIMRLAYKKKYSLIRRYYCARNHVYYIRKYKKYCNVKLELLISLRAFIQVILFGHPKFKLLNSMIRGIKDGFNIDIEPYHTIR